MSEDATTAIGIDIGGTGIKGAIVDVATGELKSERVKLPTPQGGEPEDIVATVKQIIDALGEVPAGTPLGVCFPAAIVHGTTMSAANVSPSWIGLEARSCSRSAWASRSRSSTTRTPPATPRPATARPRTCAVSSS
ncbi:hypothetical protein MAFF212519_11460 [Clavibacter michiganensis]